MTEDLGSDSDDEADFDDDGVDDSALLLDGRDAVPGPEGRWMFSCNSQRSSQMFGNLPQRVGNDTFKLEYDAADALLLDKAKAEIRYSLSQVRHAVFHSDNGQKIDAAVAFAGAMPEQFIKHFCKWLKSGSESSGTPAASPLRTSPRRQHAPVLSKPLVSFQDLIEFLRCEMTMRHLNISATELAQYYVNSDTLLRFRRVRTAMTKADRPASERRTHLGVAQFPAFTFDPLLDNMIDALNRHWTDLFFVPGVTWVDLDDDKLPHTSPLWKLHGMKRTPTKDKKLKPVFHLVATIGSGNICYMNPDKLGLKLCDMLRTAIHHLLPSAQPALRALHAFLLDRGYLEIAKYQHVMVTNLIQIMQEMHVKYLGTVKNGASFPFVIVERNEDGKTEHNKRLITSSYGMRSSVVARRTVAGVTIQASVMRHGKGKHRAARIATNIPQCMGNTWVYETNSVGMNRLTHANAPVSRPNIANNKERIEHALDMFRSTIWQMTRDQRSDDWRLARLWRFTSTTSHVAINVTAAPYFDSELQILHAAVLTITQLTPRNEITFQNATSLEDGDVPTQRSGSTAQMSGSISSQPQRHSNTTKEFWLRGKDSKLPALKANIATYNIELPLGVRVTRDLCARYLAMHFMVQAEDQTRANSTQQAEDEQGNLNGDGEAINVQREDVPIVQVGNGERENNDGNEDDGVPNENDAIPIVGADNFISNQKAFLQRMMAHWFMKPFQSKTGDAIDQGIENESSVIKVLHTYVKLLSNDTIRIQKVREFGLLVRRDCKACSSSPDGVFPLLKKNDSGVFEFESLCVLEMKTRGNENTVDTLIEQVRDIGAWIECDAGTAMFKSSIPDPAYRSQVCQHAAALGLQYVLMVYSVPGALPKRMVLVHFSNEQIDALVRLQSSLATKYLGFAHGIDAEAVGELPDIGADFSDAYGYAQEHHTAELWLKLWIAHAKDVEENGTPMTCRRFIDLAYCFWNKCMGNVDTVRKVIRRIKAVRGPDSGPGSLMFLNVLDYTFFNAFRLYQHAQIESKLESFTTFKQLQKARQTISSSPAFLFMLSHPDCLNYERMQRFYPGLREAIDRGFIEDPPEAVRVLCQPAQGVTTVAKSSGYKRVVSFLDPSNALYRLRLDVTQNHLTKTSDKKETSKEEEVRTVRSRCVLCCLKCDEHSKTTNAGSHTRLGRLTVQYCLACDIYLCKKCFRSFHEDKVPTIPKCAPSYLNTPMPARRLTLGNTPVSRSPNRISRLRSGDVTESIERVTMGEGAKYTVTANARPKRRSTNTRIEVPVRRRYNTRSISSRDHGRTEEEIAAETLLQL